MTMEFLPDAEVISRRLDQLAAAGPVAPVAPDVPLLASLSAQENLELIGAFHGHFTSRDLTASASVTLARLGIAYCAPRHRDELTAREAFLVQVGRAAMRPQAMMVLVTPFSQVPELDSDGPIEEALAALEVTRFRVLDYPSNRNLYSSLTEATP
ncbi:MAG: hypothetical protein ACLFRB_11695 [Thiohalorhabdus sp.]|uniref:hypothetical protein n=1 Tax=Thiohalorhabdus sp. TaxID=3094134 RepID=UPI00397F85D5